MSQVARELGIRPQMLRTWKRQAESRAGLGNRYFPGNGRLASDQEEMRHLRRELEQAKQGAWSNTWRNDTALAVLSAGAILLARGKKRYKLRLHPCLQPIRQLIRSGDQ